MALIFIIVITAKTSRTNAILIQHLQVQTVVCHLQLFINLFCNIHDINWYRHCKDTCILQTFVFAAILYGTNTERWIHGTFWYILSAIVEINLISSIPRTPIVQHVWACITLYCFNNISVILLLNSFFNKPNKADFIGQ